MSDETKIKLAKQPQRTPEEAWDEARRGVLLLAKYDLGVALSWELVLRYLREFLHYIYTEGDSHPTPSKMIIDELKEQGIEEAGLEEDLFKQIVDNSPTDIKSGGGYTND